MTGNDKPQPVEPLIRRAHESGTPRLIVESGKYRKKCSTTLSEAVFEESTIRIVRDTTAQYVFRDNRFERA